jgi:hypothetical protein
MAATEIEVKFTVAVTGLSEEHMTREVLEREVANWFKLLEEKRQQL